MWELTAKVAEASNVLTRKLRRAPSSEEIAEHLNVNVSAVRLAVERSRSPVSLDRVASHYGRMTLQVHFHFFLHSGEGTMSNSLIFFG